MSSAANATTVEVVVSFAKHLRFQRGADVKIRC